MTEALQEYVDSRGVSIRVDRNAGVLRGVKLIGLESKNGRRYRDSALAKAAGLYESAKVNVNHSKEGPAAPRDYRDRLGVIRNVEHRPREGLFGELHFNPKHALAEQLIWDAEHNPANVGLSHSVLARVSQENRHVVVDEITHVQSVDLVADPAATHGLFEHANHDVGDDERLFWRRLTDEQLQQNRPDLWASLRANGSAALEEELQELRQRDRRREREDLIRRSIEDLTTGDRPLLYSARDILGETLFQTLLTIDDERQIRRLIEERLTLEQRRHSDNSKRTSVPLSVEQGATERNRLSISSAGDFARAISTMEL